MEGRLGLGADGWGWHSGAFLDTAARSGTSWGDGRNGPCPASPASPTTAPRMLVQNPVSSLLLLLSAGRAEMGTNLPAVDLGVGRTAVSVSAGSWHTCALMVRSLHVGNCRMGQPGPTTRVPRCRTSTSAANTRLSPSLTCVPNIVLSACRRMTRLSSAGAATGMEFWGWATPFTGATVPTVLAHRAPPPRLACWP